MRFRCTAAAGSLATRTRTQEQLSWWVKEQQIPRVKIKIGESWGSDERRDLARVQLAREVIGPDAELYVDANGGYTTGQAVRIAAELTACGVTWFEEPVSSQDLAGLAAIRRQIRRRSFPGASASAAACPWARC